MCESNGAKQENDPTLKRPKQTLVLLTILALTVVTATSNGLYRAGNYREFLLPAPGVLLMLILTEWKGRKALFLTLFGLSLLSSLTYLTLFEYFEYRPLCVIFHSPVHGSAFVLLYIVISEYCDPKRRFFHLVANSAVQILFYWITLVLQFNQHYLEFFGDWMQYVNVILGVFGLWSVFKWPESPYWLASKRRYQESAKAFVELRGVSESEELRFLTDSKPRPGSFKMFFAPILISFPMFCITWSFKASSLALYEYYILSEARTNNIGSYWMFLAAKCIAAVLSVLTVLIPINVPRKVLFLLSYGYYFLSEFLFMFAIAVPPILILVVDTIVDYGPRIVTLPLIVEIIPQKFVSLVTAFVSVLYFIMEYFLSDSDMVPIYLTGNAFLLGIFIVLITFTIGYFVMPETREKTLIEIEQLYVSKKDKPPQAIQTDL